MSGVFAIARQDMATGAFDWRSGSWLVMLLGVGYEPDYERDATLADIPPAAQLSLPTPLSGLAVSDGWCQAKNVPLNRLATPLPIDAVVVYRAADQRLIVLLDT